MTIQCLNCGGFTSNTEECTECSQNPKVLNNQPKLENLKVARQEINNRIQEVRDQIKIELERELKERNFNFIKSQTSA